MELLHSAEISGTHSVSSDNPVLFDISLMHLVVMAGMAFFLLAIVIASSDTYKMGLFGFISFIKDLTQEATDYVNSPAA